MAKYLITWEANINAMSNDPNQRIATDAKSLELTKQWLKENPKSDWGIFVGETAGFGLVEGDWKSVAVPAALFSPGISFKVHQVLSVNEFDELIKTIKERMETIRQATIK